MMTCIIKEKKNQTRIKAVKLIGHYIGHCHTQGMLTAEETCNIFEKANPIHAGGFHHLIYKCDTFVQDIN